MIYNILTDDRKEIVSRLEELTGRKASYTRVPRCAYILDGIVVEKNGTVTTEADADMSLLNQLIQAGLIEEVIQEEEQPEDSIQPIKPNISFPVSKHRPESIRNLVFTIYSRGKLLSKSTGGVFSASDELVEELEREIFRTTEEAVKKINEAGENALHGLSFTDEQVIFDGFPETIDPLAITAWTALSEAINKAAIKQMHVRPKEVDTTNEKFAFRTWLARIGMNGPEYKKERNLMYKNLTGHTAFRTKADEEKWKSRQAARRMEMKAQREKTVNGAEE